MSRGGFSEFVRAGQCQVLSRGTMRRLDVDACIKWTEGAVGPCVTNGLQVWGSTRVVLGY